MTTEEIKIKVAPLAHKYNLNFMGLFGSRARGEARPDSDYDFIVRFSKTPSLVQFIRLENELEDALQSPVDLIIEGSEKPFIKPALEKDLISIYG